MTINLIVILIILVLGFYYSQKDKCNSAFNRKKYIKTITFILIIHAGLRNVAVGSDTYVYFQYFEDVKNVSWSTIYEDIITYYHLGIGKDVGYLLFEKAVQIFTDEFQVFLLVVAFIFFSFLGYFIFKNSSSLISIALSYVIYFAMFYNVFSISAIRQSLATAAALYGYELIKKRKLFRFLILMLVASLMHKTVLIFLPFYFIAHLKKERIFLVISFLAFPIVFVFRNTLADYIKVLSGYNEYEQFEGAGTYYFTAFFILISIIALLRRKIVIQNNMNARASYFAFGLVLILLPMSWIHPAALRITMYFSIFMLLLIPQILNSFKSFSLRNNLYAYTILLFILLFIQANWNNPIPYGFFWEKMALGENYD
ncbi:EpsG family protein [Chryseobacterium luquanense]|uniref:EpsG family protein n=1 Tax=Chryseobacterium luquanense TaxID=2983766 RepID=A0ABT3Y058_9FLAO|nr:EpsG family protein [Chryseobacterium luquanense]MCX8531518.1 EpsG family protein [Chryseobacterium luquanense]